jgi:hypothetical protein
MRAIIAGALVRILAIPSYSNWDLFVRAAETADEKNTIQIQIIV